MSFLSFCCQRADGSLCGIADKADKADKADTRMAVATLLSLLSPCRR